MFSEKLIQIRVGTYKYSYSLFKFHSLCFVNQITFYYSLWNFMFFWPIRKFQIADWVFDLIFVWHEFVIVIEDFVSSQISQENVDIVGLQEVRISESGENQLYQLQQTPQLRQKYQYALYASLLSLFSIVTIISIHLNSFFLRYELVLLIESVRLFIL